MKCSGLSTLFLGFFWVAISALAGDPKGEQLYREQVEPILVEKCYACHSVKSQKSKGGLQLDSRAAMLRGGENGPAVILGQPEESLLIKAVRHLDELAMPPKQPKLPDKSIERLADWIKAGAPVSPTASESTARIEHPSKHWAFQELRPVSVPTPGTVDWVRSPIDAFILAKLDAQGIRPSAPADRATWLRRVSFDLIGLPPTPEEIEAFRLDHRPDAYERVVDRLLASPRYGEKWATHWLDLVRYAESEGYEYDRHVPDLWRFRDYVIASFNADKPLDRFISEQLAGDELDPNDPECLVASAFHRLGPVRRNAGNPEIALSRNEVLTERTDIIGSAFLGLTVGCARCHHHKLEPISQKDYYQLQAYLASTEENNIVRATPAEKRAWEQEVQAIKDKMKSLKSEATRLEGAAKARLLEKVEELEDQIPSTPSTIPATKNDFARRTPIHVLKRGDWNSKGEAVGARPPSVLVSASLGTIPDDSPRPRTELARWLVGRNNPLTARVLVNRIWSYHFGSGLVRTVNDFGTRALPPSHPELLDWLVGELRASGWRIKPLHRAIVLSSTYRQSSRASGFPPGDPENRLLSSFPRRRLEAEEIRDAMLAVSGRLNLKSGGASVMVPVDADLIKLLYKPAQWRVTPDLKEHDRRSVYLFNKRNLRLPFLEAFDAPSSMIACGRREASNHAPQSLELLNGNISNELAWAFCRRLEAEAGRDPQRVVSLAFRLALGREPTVREREIALAHLKDRPLVEFALALFNVNGFLYVL